MIYMFDLKTIDGAVKHDKVLQGKDIIVREILDGELKNGWRANGGHPFLTKINNIVTLYLLIRDGNSGSGVVIFNIPQQFRPKATCLCCATARGDEQLIVINTNGDVAFDGLINNSTIFLQTSWLTN